MSENRIAELGTEAHDDLNRLLGTSLGIAREQLEAHGVFLPFAVGLSTDASEEGEMRLLAVQPPEDTENPEADIDADVMMKDLTELLTQQKEDFKAVAMISDVTLLETGGDAIHADAEHSAGGAVAVVQAYTPPSPEADEPVWTFDEPATEATELKIWA